MHAGTMGRRIALALALAVVCLLPLPSAASAYTPSVRCTALVTQVNQERTRADLRLQNALCIIGKERTLQFAARNYAWHDIGYAIRRLQQMGFSYRWGGDFCGIGEVIGWTTWQYSYASQYADRFAKMWRASATHWAVINGASYQRGGGDMTKDGARMYAAFYVIDRTC